MDPKTKYQFTFQTAFLLLLALVCLGSSYCWAAILDGYGSSLIDVPRWGCWAGIAVTFSGAMRLCYLAGYSMHRKPV